MGNLHSRRTFVINLCMAAAGTGLTVQAGADEVVAFHSTETRVVVTGTREEGLLSETPASVGVIDEKTVRQDRPTHPAQVMGQVPGVAVAVTNGEGHTTAIRQPFTTNPVYLFLEDGIPIRSTGFFNHNALYETNIPVAGGIEVTRGPGTALYGSDAIGGIVNVLTRTPPTQREFHASPDFGSFGWRRLIAGGGTSLDHDAWRADLNVTHTDGWRDKTAYDRQSGVARWDHSFDSGAMAKTVLSYSRIDQETGANSPLVESDYRNNPTRNYLPIAYRKVNALRLSTAWEQEWGGTLISVTPYFRDDGMELLASFMLNSDPTVASTSNRSYGVLAKWRRNFPGALRPSLIAGVDVDISPGSREEDRLDVSPTGSGAQRVFSTYAVGPRVYDYAVTFQGVSPYLHGEISPLDRLRVTAGVRFDRLEYDFDNHREGAPIAVPGAFPGLRYYGQADDTKKTFTHTSPKLGATFALAADTHLYASYNHGFRAPSESQVFRPSAATSSAAAQALVRSSLDLKPIRAQQAELGVRGQAGPVHYDVVAYRLDKRDDILTFRDTLTNFTQSVNAGRTRHEGVEVGLGASFTRQLSIDVSWSRARHKYEEWVTSGGNFTGKEIESAPRDLGNVRLNWAPAADARVTLEWTRIGKYWMDAANTARYPGHDLFNARANWPLTKRIALFGSITNIADKRHAASASITSGTPVFSPGLPRSYNAGLELKW
ncbi:MAG TPA: TonB-dependent receptor [Usitatibacteraceae bacterium]|nr:TonB-dependent receptor [Usitatibacteraceae bacterium]